VTAEPTVATDLYGSTEIVYMNSRYAFFLLVGLINACGPKYPPPPGFVDACYGGNFSKRLAGATPKLYLRIHASPKTWAELAKRFAAFGALHDLRYFDTSVSEPGLRITLYTYGDYDGQMHASEFRQFLSDWPGGVNTGLPSGETIPLISSP
jgi:hypothetical protein